MRFSTYLAQQGPAAEVLPLRQQVIRPQRPDVPESELNPRFTFERFIVGNTNNLTFSAAQAVVENPASVYNPLLIYGGVGLGKTHLLHAIGNHCHRRGLQVLYVSSEEFTHDLIHAIRTHTTHFPGEISQHRCPAGG